MDYWNCVYRAAASILEIYLYLDAILIRVFDLHLPSRSLVFRYRRGRLARGSIIT